jgi:hypothetical protein
MIHWVNLDGAQMWRCSSHRETSFRTQFSQSSLVFSGMTHGTRHDASASACSPGLLNHRSGIVVYHPSVISCWVRMVPICLSVLKTNHIGMIFFRFLIPWVSWGQPQLLGLGAHKHDILSVIGVRNEGAVSQMAAQIKQQCFFLIDEC